MQRKESLRIPETMVNALLMLEKMDQITIFFFMGFPGCFLLYCRIMIPVARPATAIEMGDQNGLKNGRHVGYVPACHLGLPFWTLPSRSNCLAA